LLNYTQFPTGENNWCCAPPRLKNGRRRDKTGYWQGAVIKVDGLILSEFILIHMPQKWMPVRLRYLRLLLYCLTRFSLISVTPPSTLSALLTLS